MIATIDLSNHVFQIDFSKPIDISIPLVNSDRNPIAWYLDKPDISPVVMGDWIGKVSEGKSSTNFNTISFNPHAHGTHTECLGHITKDFFSVNDSLKEFFFLGQLLTIQPELQLNGDFVITLEQVRHAWLAQGQKAVIFRTLPNSENKKSAKYSHTNPPYLAWEVGVFLREQGVAHLLIDLPSVDKEKDEGKLLAHKAFWNVTDVHHLNAEARLNATITEMIYVDEAILDGMYLVNLQVAAFENDASPSRPVLYAIHNK